MSLPHESFIERRIREAMERGEFDDLPGSGKPLPGIADRPDDDWWVKGMLRREGLDMSGAMPPTLQLRKEADTFPESLVELRTEESVREVLEDFNRRVKLDRLRPATGPGFPLLAPTVDVDELVGQWRTLRDELEVQLRAEREARYAAQQAERHTRRTRWWRRLRRDRPAG